jgi:hypothetical protein
MENNSESAQTSVHNNWSFKDELNIPAKHGNFDSSNDGEYHNYIDQSVELGKNPEELQSTNRDELKPYHEEVSIDGSISSKSSLSDIDMSEDDQIALTNKYRQRHTRDSKETELPCYQPSTHTYISPKSMNELKASIDTSTPAKNHKLPIMKVTFNKQKTNKCLSHERGRSRKNRNKRDLQVNSNKMRSANYTMTKNSLREYNTSNQKERTKKHKKVSQLFEF